jgi:Helix-turn-helix domain
MQAPASPGTWDNADCDSCCRRSAYASSPRNARHGRREPPELADDIADRISGTYDPAELDALVKDMWVQHTHGRLTDNDMEILEEAARARREAFQARRIETRPTPSGSPRAACRRPSRPREKLFGNGRPVPLDREAKNRIMVLVKALMHPTEPRKHYGKVTAKTYGVVKVLLWVFHNARTGLCFPSYEAIAKAACCHRDTVCEAIAMLEAAGILTWCHRLKRVTINGVRKVIRTSNSYRFNDPGSKSEIAAGTRNQDSPSLVKPAEIRPIDPEGPLERAIALGKKAYGRA